MSFLSRTQLLQRSRNVEKSMKRASNLVANKDLATTSIFLSHSHQDREVIEGMIDILAGYGIVLYVDWQDSGMPSITSRETAEKIKTRIEELDYFLLLATNNALASRWVPWEVGIADMVKPFEKIAIIPVSDPSGHYQGNEYLQLYQTVEISDSKELAVFPPMQNKGMSLKSWLK